MTDDLKLRLGGVVCLLVAAAVAWWGVWLPLEEARAGAAEVRWPLRVVVLVPLAAVFGLFFLIAGARYPYRDAARQTLTPVGWALFAVIAVAALSSYLWVSTTLSALGYR